MIRRTLLVLSLVAAAGCSSEKSAGGPFAGIASAQEAPSFLKTGKTYQFQIGMGSIQLIEVLQIDSKAGWVKGRITSPGSGQAGETAWLNLANVNIMVEPPEGDV